MYAQHMIKQEFHTVGVFWPGACVTYFQQQQQKFLCNAVAIEFELFDSFVSNILRNRVASKTRKKWPEK